MAQDETWPFYRILSYCEIFKLQYVCALLINEIALRGHHVWFSDICVTQHVFNLKFVQPLLIP